MTNTKLDWALSLDEYVAGMHERHGKSVSITQEAYQRADVLMKAAQETVALCRKYGGDSALAVEWIVQPEKHEAVLLGHCVKVAEIETKACAVAVALEEVK